jgi:hypothetical protein
MIRLIQLFLLTLHKSRNMKNIIAALVFVLGLAAALPSASVAAAEKEKSFIEAYRKAYETKNEAALKSFLYTKGADPQALEFYIMMITSDLGGKITNIELRDLTADDKKKAAEILPSPTGGKSKLPFAPEKKLVLNIETSDANGKSTSSSESFVGEVDGKLMIPVPVPVK